MNYNWIRNIDITRVMVCFVVFVRLASESDVKRSFSFRPALVSSMLAKEASGCISFV